MRDTSHVGPLPIQEVSDLADLARATLDAAAPLACALAERAARTKQARDARLATDALRLAICAFEIADVLALESEAA